MMPMGIERCGFLASSPVQTQEATCAPLHCTARGKSSQGISQQGLSMVAQDWGAGSRGCRRGGVPGHAAAALAEGMELPGSLGLQPPLGHASPSPPPSAPSPYRAC